MLQGGGIAMKLNIDEILDLYFQGYYLRDILSVIPGTKENKEEIKKTYRKKKKIVTPKKVVNKDKYSTTLSILDIKENEAIRFNKAIKSNTNLVAGRIYNILVPTNGNRKTEKYFEGELVEEMNRFIILKHKFGYCETFLKVDIVSGLYQIREA